MGDSATSNVPTLTLPAVGGMKPVIMRIVVDFPAPLGPRKPSTSPRSTEKEIPSTARFAPKAFAKLWTLIIVNYSASESRRMVEITNFDSVVNWFLTGCPLLWVLADGFGL